MQFPAEVLLQIHASWPLLRYRKPDTFCSALIHAYPGYHCARAFAPKADPKHHDGPLRDSLLACRGLQLQLGATGSPVTPTCGACAAGVASGDPSQFNASLSGLG